MRRLLKMFGVLTIASSSSPLFTNQLSLEQAKDEDNNYRKTYYWKSDKTDEELNTLFFHSYFSSEGSFIYKLNSFNLNLGKNELTFSSLRFLDRHDIGIWWTNIDYGIWNLDFDHKIILNEDNYFEAIDWTNLKEIKKYLTVNAFTNTWYNQGQDIWLKCDVKFGYTWYQDNDADYHLQFLLYQSLIFHDFYAKTIINLGPGILLG